MGLDGQLLREMLHEVTAADPRRRSLGADALTDVLSALDADDVAVIVRALVRLAVAESDADCREAELHALFEIGTWHEISADLLAPLRPLMDVASAADREYLDEWFED